MSIKKRIFYLFFILLLTSPFVWVIGRNYSGLYPLREKFIYPNYQVFVDDVNTLRGELSQEGIPNTLARLLVNKYTNFSYEVFKRYLKTFDPTFLFFSGDVDVLKSPKSSGPLYLTLLIPFIYGINMALKNKNKLIMVLLLLSPLPASLLVKETETLFRIPFFLIFIYLSSLGFICLAKVNKYRYSVYLLVILFVFELARFIHDFCFHYPGRM